MPELPEVETIVRQLGSKILNKTILSVEIFDKKVMDKRISEILPAKIVDVQRRGKSIIVSLDGNYRLLIHLRMTGHFYYLANDCQVHDRPAGSYDSWEDYKQYLSGIFKLNDGSRLTFNEIRRFGSIRLFSNQQLRQELSKLGPEPLDLKRRDFIEIIQSYPAAVIKNKLLDQSCIAGIGNIYAQEALYHAGINPNNQIKDIGKQQLIKLHREIQRILQLAIKNNGATVDNFSHLTGKGNFQNFLAVYNQEYCPKKHPVEKVNIGGRGTSYCKVCQK